jgi:SET domain-containing protein
MALANHHYSLSIPTFFLNRDTRIPDRTLSINYLQASETSDPTCIELLRNSEMPNVRCEKEKHYRFFALRDINPVEELTVDYATYSEEP